MNLSLEKAHAKYSIDDKPQRQRADVAGVAVSMLPF